MNIESFQGGYDKNFSYLIWCEKTKLAAIIDPAVDSIKILEKINQLNLTLIKILITHTHHDHYQYLTDYIYKYPNIEICCNEQSIKLFLDFNVKPIENNEIISIGEILFIALFTPGHYHDSICFWNKADKIVFTGDTMFVGRTGRVKSATSNIEELYNSIYKILLQLPLETTIYPGHHYGFSKTITIKKNIENSNFFQCKSLNEFKKIMNKFEKNYGKN